jgi:hypothetical protein
MIDYAKEEKQRFLRDCAQRTPLYREETIAEKIIGGIAFVLFVLMIVFI